MATKARLHWFWRGTVAVPFAAMGNTIIIVILAVLRRMQVDAFVLAVAIILATTLPGMVAYGWLTRKYGPPVPDGELHCRRCHHILRGLSEPRCPECGEAI